MTADSTCHRGDVPHIASIVFPGCVDLLPWQAADPAMFPGLLTSCGRGRWDILFAHPQSCLIQTDPASSAVWHALDQAAAQSRVALAPELAHLPFLGGWLFYLGYELLHTLEPHVPVHPGEGFPLGALWRVPGAVLVDHQRQQTWVVGDAAWGATWQALAQALQGPQPTLAATTAALGRVAEETPDHYLDGVVRVKRYIRAGDVFQVNLSREWQLSSDRPLAPDALFERLRRSNPAPFAASLRLGESSVLSSSPERLLQLRGDLLETQPIAGTHPRLSDPLADQAQIEQLQASAKERAEHIMLVDLERNDLGRVARPGSVRVTELLQVYSYAYVHHLESVLQARLAPPYTAIDALRAMFPGGTITGCPKVRTMQIIQELESGPRLAYTGSVGYLSHDGQLDSNILIRTMLLHEHRLRFRAGAGIVADSDPQRELEETRAKARGLMRALEAC